MFVIVGNYHVFDLGEVVSAAQSSSQIECR